MSLTQAQKTTIISSVAVTFADMCNPENRGKNFSWVASFPRIAALVAKTQITMSCKERYPSKALLAEVENHAEEYATFLVNRAGFNE